MPLPSLTIGTLTAPLPIIQGGMGIGISLAGLASAVANAGGIGVIATAGIGWNEPDFGTDPMRAHSRALQTQIRKARSMTKGILGVNIMVALTNYAEIVATACEEGIDLIISGAGLPLALPKFVGDRLAPMLTPIVSSGRAAALLCKNWKNKYGRIPDAFVVEGPLAGGHLGFKPEQIHDPAYALESLVPEVLTAVAPFEEAEARDIPVIAAGGVYTGGDIAKYLRMGAAGVQMGTRFVVTHECDAADGFKQSYLDAREEDIAIIASPVGMPGRAIRNSFIREMESGKRKPLRCPFHCIHSCDVENSAYCITVALLTARRGDREHGLTFAGHNAYRVDAILSVQELIQSLVDDYERSCAADPCPVTSSDATSGGT